MPRIGERGWIHSGVKVFDNTAAPTEWTDLDLSGVVGKNRALVFLKIKNRDVDLPDAYFFRINDEIEEVASTSSNACMNNVVYLRNDYIAHFVMETDDNGIIEWKATTTYETDIWVLGYIR